MTPKAMILVASSQEDPNQYEMITKTQSRFVNSNILTLFAFRNYVTPIYAN